ncbi:peptidylprolyl isomerase [Candidatus Bathyarchaeota archaeon]|nr:peptidylprolyl isomerase [Candidatus Bathyarchaeota archaeon]
MFMRESKVTEIAVFETSLGTIEVELNRDKAPTTVENFVSYIEEGFYDGLVFHRVIKEFMIQGGGFYPDGTWKEGHDPIENEGRNGLENKRGTIAMARTSEPNSATCQFFINTVDNAGLNYPNPDGHGYAVFGEVVEGLDVVDAIESVLTGVKQTPYGDMSDWPRENVVIVRAYMKEG